MIELSGAVKTASSAMLVLAMLTGLAGCNEDNGANKRLSAERDRLKQEVTEAREATEKAMTRNTVLQSRLKALEGKMAAAATAEAAEAAEAAAVVEEVVAPVAGGEQGAALEAELALVVAERDRLQALMQDNEDALRDGIAAKAQQQHFIAALEDKLAASEQRAAVSSAGLADVEGRLKVLEAEKASGLENASATITQMASLKEQLVAVQADKAALETRLAAQDQELQAATGVVSKARGRITTLEQLLTEARTHGNSLAEQLAAIQADTRTLEERLVATSNQLQAARQQAQAESAAPVAAVAATEAPAAETALAVTAAHNTELAQARQEQDRLRERATQAEQRTQDLEQQLAGAVAQVKSLQDEVIGLRHEGEELEQEMQAVEAKVVPKVDSSALAVDDAVDLQALLEEGQQLLEACSASLDTGAQDMFELEQQSMGMRNALQRQREVAAMRCNRVSKALHKVMLENRRLRAMMAPPPSGIPMR